MKKVKRIYQAPEKHWVGNGFHVHSMFNYQEVEKNLDPFLMMDYAAPKYFQGGRQDDSVFDLRGVGEHPHRGFETVTLAYQGEVAHRDSYGGGTIKEGDVQWMTAGSGVMHEEFHSENFAKTGGIFEMVQLWVNLPKKDKMTTPKYQAIQAKDITNVKIDDGVVRVIAGDFENHQGSASTFSPINMWDVKMNGKHQFKVPSSHNVIILALDGTVLVNDEIARKAELITFERGGEIVNIETNNEAHFLILTGEPLNEPIVGYGPFVMNTREEIVQAFEDVRNGKFGQLA